MMDEAAARRIEAQLALWGDEMKKREAQLQTSGHKPRFAAVLHVDELRVLLVTAQARFEALQADPTEHRDLLTAAFDRAWKELAATIDLAMPQP